MVQQAPLSPLLKISVNARNWSGLNLDDVLVVHMGHREGAGYKIPVGESGQLEGSALV